MSSKTTKIVYWVATGLLTALMLMSSSMYVIKNEMISETFSRLGFPTYIVYPLALAKVLGLIAIWTGRSKTLREWAYAGFFFTFILAASAHLNTHDGEHIPAIVAIALVLVSYFTGRKMLAND